MKILPWLLTTVLLLSASIGCSKKDKQSDKASPPPSPTIADSEASPPAVSTVALTMALVNAATGVAKSGTDWNEALAAAETRLGKVTTVHGAEHRWAARDGDQCAYLSLEMLSADTGAKVGVVQGPVAVQKGEDEGEWNRCLDSVGAQGQIAEDQKAPEPPAEGGVTTVSDLLAGVEGKPGKWVGKEVSIKGFYVSASTAFADTVKTTTLSISATKGERKGSIGCAFASGEVVPKFEPWDEVTVTGRVHASFGGGLEACKLQP
jgi:hypothetical protein